MAWTAELMEVGTPVLQFLIFPVILYLLLGFRYRDNHIGPEIHLFHSWEVIMSSLYWNVLSEHLSYRTKAFGSLLNVQCHISIFFVPTCFPDFLPCTVCSNAQPPTLSFLFLTSAINPVCFGKHGILCLSVPLGNMTGVCISSGDQRGKDS